MMKLLTKLPDYVVGISASGEIDAKDYKTVLIPAVDSALGKHKQIRMLYQLTPDFKGFTTGAMWDDSKLGFTHLKAWEKIAVVTDAQWVANLVKMFAFALPCQVRIFSNSEIFEAENWIVA